MMEDLPGLAPGPAPSPVVAPDPAPDAYRPVGLTKAVLSLHTQKEEQAFLSRFRDLGRLRGLDGSSTAPSAPGEQDSYLGPPRTLPLACFRTRLSRESGFLREMSLLPPPPEPCLGPGPLLASPHEARLSGCSQRKST